MNKGRVITYTLTRDDLRIVGRFVDGACVGGMSNVRDKEQREGTLKEDQVTGLIGNYVLALWRDGHPGAFIESREAQDKTPTQGDGGQDLPGLNIDVKASCMRAGSDPLRYNLWVRPRERHQDHTYVLALIAAKGVEEIRHSHMLTVYLVGWCTDKDLPDELDSKGRHAVHASRLLPMPPMRYSVAA